MNDINTEIPKGDLQLYDYYKPPLEAGNYTIEVQHTLGIDGAEAFHATQEFVVSAPQFNLSPAQVVNQYPPAGGTGMYGEVLPHIVLRDPMLAWERSMDDPAVFPPAPTPWLALLVFEENELLPDENDELLPGYDPGTKATTAGILAFQALNDKHDAKGRKILAPTPEITADIQNALADETAHPGDASYKVAPCQYIKMKKEVFQQVMPRLDELRYLSHVRKVNTGDRPVLGLSEHGLYSVTMANRFPGVPPKEPVSEKAPAAPATGDAQASTSAPTKKASAPAKKNIVHLVSLEGMAAHLKGPAVPDGYDVVALLSLASWNFFAQHDLPQDFKALANALVPQGSSPESRWLRLPPPAITSQADPAQQEVKSRIDLGYVPLAYHTRSGENTFAWYRGPLAPHPTASGTGLAPHPTASGTGLGPFPSADAALIYDTNFDVFDVSLAAAWELGREVALADVSFGPKMLHFRRNATQLLDTLHHQLNSVHLADSNSDQAQDVRTPAQQADALSKQVIGLKIITVQHAFARLLTRKTDPLAVGSIGTVGTKLTDSPAQAADTAAGVPNTPASRKKLTSIPPSSTAAGVPNTTAAPAAANAYAELTQMLTQLSNSPDARTKLQVLLDQDIAPLADWLSRFLLLSLVPFDNLVPNEGLLPAESLRFFHLDEQWFRAALDGALSLGQDSSKHNFINDLVKEVLLEKAKVAAASRSAKDGGEETILGESAVALPHGISGFLLRSDMVVGWPNLAVYPKDDYGRALPILRIDHLAPNLLLCLFDGVPKQLILSEPSESLRFGIEDHGGIALRDTSGLKSIGRQLTGVASVMIRDMKDAPDKKLCMRLPLNCRVLNLAPGSIALGIAADEDGLINSLKKGFPPPNSPLPDLSPSAFSLQMVKAPEALELPADPHFLPIPPPK